MKNKHLTHNERIEIEKGLNENCSFKEIAAWKDKSHFHQIKGDKDSLLRQRAQLLQCIKFTL